MFTASGHTAFGFTDGFDEAEATAALRTDGRLRPCARRRCARSPTARSSRPRRSSWNFQDPRAERFDAVSLERLTAGTKSAHEETRALLDPETRVSTSATVNREDWRVDRSDGTAASWSVPRFDASTTRSRRARAEASPPCARTSSRRTTRRSGDPGAARARPTRPGAVRKALGLRARDVIPPGVYPLLIDYALAKGLAHEAFGHAAEADSFRSSVLASGGRFRSGERAWGARRSGSSTSRSPAITPTSPIGANGFRRERVEIVRRGVLHEALADLFSAGPGGVPAKGAKRAESYRSTPLPRMSNIRIELDRAAPLPRPFEADGARRTSATSSARGRALRALPEDRVPLRLRAARSIRARRLSSSTARRSTS